ILHPSESVSFLRRNQAADIRITERLLEGEGRRGHGSSKRRNCRRKQRRRTENRDSTTNNRTMGTHALYDTLLELGAACSGCHQGQPRVSQPAVLLADPVNVFLWTRNGILRHPERQARDLPFCFGCHHGQTKDETHLFTEHVNTQGYAI